LTLLTVSGDDVDHVCQWEHGTPSSCADSELLLAIKRRGTVVITIIVGLKTNSVIVKRLNPK
jgi:hypothetical protein